MPKPIIFVSKCLGFAACRWNGAMVPDEFVKKLKNHVEIVTSCPECEIGLGVPRDPIRIVYKGSSFRLMQLNTGKDVTGPMRKFTDGFLSGIREIDGFILKDRSPSCGIKDVKVYPDIESSSSLKKKSGFFGEEALKRFSNTAIESETRLTNFAVREHFLIRIFTLARFREVKKSGEIKSLIWFHAAHKLLFMVYSRKKLKIMGNIIANSGKKKLSDVLNGYEKHLRAALLKFPEYTPAVNVMMRLFGYFSDKLSGDEKRFFLSTIEEYKRGRTLLSAPIGLLRSYIARFDEKYLKDQAFFAPYPRDLAEIHDSEKGREINSPQANFVKG